MRRTYKYRAYIDEQTRRNVNRWLWKCRVLYNVALAYRMFKYKYDGETVSNYDQYDLVRRNPKFSGLEWLGLDEVNIIILQDVLKRLDLAYKAFFRRVKQGLEKPGFPRFTNYRKYGSITFGLTSGKPNGWKLQGNRLNIPRLGMFKLRLHRSIPGIIKTVTVIRDLDQWYVCFSCDGVIAQIRESAGRRVGLYMERPWFGKDSEGREIREPEFYRQAQEGLARRQQRRQRRVKGSKRYYKARELEAKWHRKIKRKRKDHHCNLAASYVDEYDVIVVNKMELKEELAGMTERIYAESNGARTKENCREEAKATLDNGWGMFIERMKTRAEACGRQVIEVENFEPDPDEGGQMNAKKLLASAGPAIAKAVGDDG